MKFRLFALGTFCFIHSSITLFAQTNTPSSLSANDILGSVREAQSHQREQRLIGQLRTSAGQVYPFILISQGSQIKYQFLPPAPDTVVQVQLNDDNSELNTSSNVTLSKNSKGETIATKSGKENLTPSNFDKKILGTDLTYEDLALKFIYWPKSRILGEETVKTLPCWKLQLAPSNHRSNYANVLLWVDKGNGSLMRAEAYDLNGALAKRFEVISGQKIDGLWYLKQMRIESMDPKTQHVDSRTYLEIKGLAK